MGLSPIPFNSYKSVKDGPIRKQAFGVSIEEMNKLVKRFEDSGFVIDSEIQKNGSLYWCQMLFKGRENKFQNITQKEE